MELIISQFNKYMENLENYEKEIDLNEYKNEMKDPLCLDLSNWIPFKAENRPQAIIDRNYADKYIKPNLEKFIQEKAYKHFNEYYKRNILEEFFYNLDYNYTNEERINLEEYFEDNWKEYMTVPNILNNYKDKYKITTNLLFDFDNMNLDGYQLGQTQNLVNNLLNHEEISDENINKQTDTITKIMFDRNNYELKDLQDPEKIKNSKFLSSFINEIKEIEDTAIYAVCVKLSISDIEKIIKNNNYTIKNEPFGLFDPNNKTKSHFKIDLEHSVTIPLRYTLLSNVNNPSWGYYSTTDIRNEKTKNDLPYYYL